MLGAVQCQNSMRCLDLPGCFDRRLPGACRAKQSELEQVFGRSITAVKLALRMPVYGAPQSTPAMAERHWFSTHDEVSDETART
jgi:hypothetical protein